MTTGFARFLGEKLGTDVEVGGAVQDFLRIRVSYKLEKPLKAELKVKIKGKVMGPFSIKYENVPFFYFKCGVMGHAECE